MSDNNLPIIPVILCGGAGMRLWPLSRSLFPKQFIPLFGECLFEQTLSRLHKLNVAHTIIMCNSTGRFFVADSMRGRQPEDYTIILEPSMRNTAAAITLAALSALEKQKDGILLVLPSDHLVKEVAAFADAVQLAVPAAAEGSLVTFGIVPQYPETGYGYIQRGKEISPGVHQVSNFREKPDQTTASQWLKQGDTYWNSGVFLFRAQSYLDAVGQYAPKILKASQEAYQQHQERFGFTHVDHESFSRNPNVSIDCAVMEKADNVVVVPADFGWSDIGSWESLSTLFQDDAQKNLYEGDVTFHNASNNIVYSDGRMIAVLGMEDCVVVDTRDVTLVAKRTKVQNIKQLVQKLEDRDCPRVHEHCQVFRPWGNYESIDEDKGFQVKRIVVNPGQKISLQLHHQRSEHWVIVRGTAHIVRGEEELVLKQNESIYIPAETKHCLENRGTDSLFLVEVQCGDHLGEDDIVRFEDFYGRDK